VPPCSPHASPPRPPKTPPAARRRPPGCTSAYGRSTRPRTHAREIENLATLPQNSPAITALRSRIIARFTELEAERTEINERLAALERATGHQDEPGLLDALPLLGDALPGLPAAIQARLFAAFGLEVIYNKQDHQVTIYATITPSTPAALADIIAISEPPTAPAGLAHSPQHPREC
jgi:hypothetical protein